MKNTRKRQVKRIKHAWALGCSALLTHCQKLTPPLHLSLSLSIQSHLFSLYLFLFMFFLLQTPKKNNNKNNKKMVVVVLKMIMMMMINGFQNYARLLKQMQVH
ncbi:hypothetical protein IHE45_05G125500 [Dioscorea alata]|uniref:Uncharacterized protein n=1 Tax=Dioscorea alata TaxID=55571 RepID=A0ACB7W4M5_DIOAL|nr:hypothetical protein IHE45_05G125500 [Dioscorea alata]